MTTLVLQGAGFLGGMYLSGTTQPFIRSSTMSTIRIVDTYCSRPATKKAAYVVLHLLTAVAATAIAYAALAATPHLSFAFVATRILHGFLFNNVLGIGGMLEQASIRRTTGKNSESAKWNERTYFMGTALAVASVYFVPATVAAGTVGLARHLYSLNTSAARGGARV